MVCFLSNRIGHTIGEETHHVLQVVSTDYPPPTHYITGDDEHREIAKACSSRETGCYTLHQQGE